MSVETDPGAFERDVEHEAHRIRVRDRARERVRAEQLVVMPPFDAGTLAEILRRPAEPPYRVAGLLPGGGSLLVVAQRKTGKTTLNLNLCDCLLTGASFLGTFEVEPVVGTVAMLNYEVSGAQLARWAAAVGIHRERLYLVNLRGRRNPLGVPEDRAKLAEALRARGTSVLVVDPFGRAYTGVSQNDPGEVGAFLAELDRFAADVGASEVVLSTHAGWNGERSRGSSALEDWADSIVTLTRDPADETRRYFRATGRDVHVEEDGLTFDSVTRHLTLDGSGSRVAGSAVRHAETMRAAVLAVVKAQPGAHVAAIRKALKVSKVAYTSNDDSRALQSAVDDGLLRVEDGPRNSKLHYIVEPTHSNHSAPAPGGSGDPLHPLSIGEWVARGTQEPTHSEQHEQERNDDKGSSVRTKGDYVTVISSLRSSTLAEGRGWHRDCASSDRQRFNAAE